MGEEMKKTIFLALISIFLLSSLIGCGGGAGSSSTPPGEQPGVPFFIELRPSQYIAQTNSFIIIRARVLNGNGNPIGNVPVRFTNLSAVGVLSATSANTNSSGYADVRLSSTTPGFATVQAEIYSGESVVRDRRTLFFTLQDVLAVRLALDADADNDLIYDEPSDLLLGEDANDNSVKIRARVYNAGGALLAGRQVTFDAERAYRVGTSILGTDAALCSDGSDTCFIAFPLGTTVFTNENGEAYVQVLVATESLRNFTSNLNIFATADNGAANMKTLFISPVSVGSISVSADPSVIAPTTSGTASTSTITAIAMTNTNQPVPDGTTINFSIDAACAAAGGRITPFGRTGVAAAGDGTATATFTAPPTMVTCTITASIGSVSDTIDVVVTAPLAITPDTFDIGSALAGSVDVQYFVSGGKAPYTIHFTLPQFVDAASPTQDGDTVGTAGTNQAVFTVRYTWTAGVEAKFQLIVVDSLGTTVSSDINITSGGGGGGDTTPPTVTSTIPTNGATGVGPDTVVIINWSENIDCATVTTDTVTITPVTPPTWTRTSCSGSQAVFTPNGQSSGTYTVTVGVTPPGITDVAGNPMAPYSFSYTVP
jgi:Bacterial Ig-like domain/Bacterial Ig-like domain (group 1)